MKKQFFRLIGGRENKTEVLNDDMLQMEKHLELVRTASQTTSKKLCQCMQTHGGGDVEKRQKRLVESNLAQSMQDASRNLLAEGDSNYLFGTYLKICGEVQAGLAREKAQYELFLDEQILSPLQSLADTEIPAVLKQRERLKKLVSEMEIAEQNYHKAERNSTIQTTINSHIGLSKPLKDEWDQAILKMEQCKDHFVVEMFDYLGREVRHSQLLAHLHLRQMEYHQNCADLLKNMKPQFHTVENSVTNRSFGKSLTDHLHATGREIALPIEACVLCLQHFGLKEEGLFRVGGGALKLRKMRAVLDGGKLDLFAYDAQDDIHAVAGALKQYLRELPDPLLTLDLYEQWIVAAEMQDHDQKLREIWTVIDAMPIDNKANFRYLMKFCALVAENQDSNKMSAGNIALVLAPNLLWADTDDVSKNVMVSSKASNIVENIITYVDYFFPGEIDFVVTPDATSYHTLPVRDSDPESALTSVPVSPTSFHKEKSHSRSSSNEMNLSDNSSSSSNKPRKQKNKAPPPPQQKQMQPASKFYDESRSPLPVRRAPSQEKPPIAAKRASTKKPDMPPPNPPSEEHNEEEPAPKPRSHVRKGGSGNHPPIPPNKPILPLPSPINFHSPALPRKEIITSFSNSPESPSFPTPEPRNKSGSASFKVGDEEITETVHVTPL